MLRRPDIWSVQGVTGPQVMGWLERVTVTRALLRASPLLGDEPDGLHSKLFLLVLAPAPLAAPQEPVVCLPPGGEL